MIPRRIAAFVALGRTTIPAQVVRNLDELESLLKAERDENVCRKGYTPEEAVYLGLRIEKLEKPKVAKHHREARRKGGKMPKGRGSSPTLQDESARLTARTAKVVGMARNSYERAKAVVASKDKKLIAASNVPHCRTCARLIVAAWICIFSPSPARLTHSLIDFRAVHTTLRSL